MSSPAPPYAYPVTNAEYISIYGLAAINEAGYLAQTLGLNSYVPNSPPAPVSPDLPTSPELQAKGRVQVGFGSATTWYGGSTTEPTINGTDKQSDATLAYYLLTPDASQGYLHSNAHPHIQILIAGRVMYTLIKPPSTPDELPEIHRIVLGQNAKNGEVTQILVPAGWWKASEIPEEDLLLLDAPNASDLKERIGGLVGEIVVPGWHPGQHAFLTEDKLKQLWNGKSGWEGYRKYLAPEEPSA